MDIILKNLIDSKLFTDFDPFILNRDNYLTDKIKFHISYEEDIKYLQIPFINDNGTVNYNYEKHTMTDEMHVDALVKGIIDNLYKHIISETRKHVKTITIENIIKSPYQTSFYDSWALPDDYYVVPHSPFIIYDIDITRLEYERHNYYINYNYNFNRKVFYFEISLFYSYPVNIHIKKLLTDDNEIKLFKRKKAIEKIKNNLSD